MEECFFILYIGRKNEEASLNNKEGFFIAFKSRKNSVKGFGNFGKHSRCKKNGYMLKGVVGVQI